jgi:hypothetical protein
MSVVEPILKPDTAAMRQHLEHLFGGHADGWIELSWTTSVPQDGRYPLVFSEWFRVTDIDGVIEHAVTMNSTPMVNVYVGAAIRNPDCMPGGRSHDSDAWKLTCVYVDLDDPDSVSAAREVWKYMKPTLIVGTGRAPHLRAQAYWKLDKPLDEHVAWQSILKAMARTLQGDRSVYNPGRVLRLAGTVAWPQKPGRTTELTFIASTTSAPAPRPSYDVKALASLFKYDPALDGAEAPRPAQPVTTVAAPSANPFGLPGEVIDDGREGYMTRMVNAAFVTYVGENGTVPSADELFEDVWPTYAKSVNLDKPGRGSAELREKCRYILDRFERGEHTKFKTLDDVVEGYNTRPFDDEPAFDSASEDGEPVTLDGVEFDDDKAAEPPRWLAKGLLHADGVAFIGGQSGAGKTFAHVHMAVGLATGTDVFGYQVKERVGTAILAAEGAGTIKMRVRVARMAREIREPLPIACIRDVPDLMQSTNHGPIAEKLRAVDKVFREAYGVRLGVVVIDTVSAAFGMQDEDDNAEAAKAIRIMAAMASTLGVVVVPIHHYGKSADTGLRGASAWRAGADTVISVIAERDQLTGDVQRRALALAKSRVTDEGPIGDFALKFMKLGEDEDGDDIGACHIVLVESDGRAAGAKLNTGEKTLKKAFEATLDQAVATAVDSGPRVRAVRSDIVRTEFAKWYPTGESDRSKRAEAVRKAYKRAVSTAAKCGLVVGVIGQDEFIWSAAHD